MTVGRLLTADEFAGLSGELAELVRGVRVPLDPPSPRHGEVCTQVGFLLHSHLDRHRVGRAVGLSGVVTERDPDTVRGADISFYSFARVPANTPLPRRGYAAVAPELVFEVRSYTDRWSQIHVKVGEYLAAGVDTVVVLDEQSERAWVYRDEDNPVELGPDQELALPAPLDGWRVPVRRFFD